MMMIEAVLQWLSIQAYNFYNDQIDRIVDGYDKCLILDGN